jgi:hypothetical protein
MRTLRLPLVLTSVVVGVVAIACTQTEQLTCEALVEVTDAGVGVADASPTAPDACGQHVERFDECPQGCEPLG